MKIKGRRGERQREREREGGEESESRRKGGEGGEIREEFFLRVSSGKIVSV